MKGFLSFFSAAIVFFVLGGLSTYILGIKDGEYKSMFNFTQFKSENILLETAISGNESWEFDGRDRYNRVNLDLHGVKAVVKSGFGEKIGVSVKSSGAHGVSVNVGESGDTISIGLALSPAFRVFSLNAEAEAEITLPTKVYDRLCVNIGSGEVEISDINADSNVLTLGSGDLKFFGTGGFTADSMEIDVGSGEAEINTSAEYLNLSMGSGDVELNTSNIFDYDVHIGSGELALNGLSGQGTIDVSSGECSAKYRDASQIDGTAYTVSSGTLSVTLPTDTNAVINAEVSSGYISVDCQGINKKLRDEETVVLGNGGQQILAHVSSGKIKIEESGYNGEEVAFLR